jgi:hypothetical protein
MESEFDKHGFLKILGLSKENFSAYYDGKWQESETKLNSINPKTNNLIAFTTTLSAEDY